jgi:hypothetical protein
MSDLSTAAVPERWTGRCPPADPDAEIEAAAVVSFDGLPMASALPAGMDEDRVAAMSAALLSLGERAAQGLGRGELSQVYIEGETGTSTSCPATTRPSWSPSPPRAPRSA